MDRAYIQANDIIRRYLTGTLSEDESRAFESACAGDPSLADELSRDWQFKAGLEELESKGQLAPLLRQSTRFFETSTFALAASVLAAVGISSALFLAVQLQNTRSELDGLEARLKVIDAPKVLVQTFRVLPTRSGRLNLNIPENGWIGLLVDAGNIGTSQVNVELIAKEGRSLVQEIATLADDGTLMLTVDSGRLAPGTYDVIVRSQTDPTTERRIGLRIERTNQAARPQGSP